MKTLQIAIEGTAPLLMNKHLGEQGGVKQEAFTETEAEKWAWDHAYISETNGKKPVIPGPNMQRALIQGANYSKGKGRATLKKTAAAGLRVTEFEIPVKAPAPVVDKRHAVIPATRGRVLVHRLRIPTPWTAKFSVDYDQELLAETQVLEIIRNTGTRVGVLNFRPEKMGPFGTFKVTSHE